MTKIVCISDTHGIHNKIPALPYGDILIHAGDFTGWGTFSEMEYFAAWMGQQEHATKIAVAGNHDECAAKNTSLMRKVFGNHGVIYLKDSYFIYKKDDGSAMRIYGTPYTPEFCGWHFMEYEHELAIRYSNIPENIDVLICHGPPRGILDESGIDLSRHKGREYSPNRVGSTALAERITHLPNLKLMVCGHIHSGRGVEYHNDVCYVNAASLGENYEPVSDQAIVVDI